MLKQISKLALLSYGSLLLAMTAFAAPPPIIPPKTGGLIIPNSSSVANQGANLNQSFLPAVTQTVIALTGALAVLFIIVGAIQILTAYGKTEKIASAKKTITWAIAGLLIAMLSYAIVSIISAIKL